LIFFIFILQRWVSWKLSFTVYFDLLFMALSWSHNSGHEFDKLTRIDSLHIFGSFFNWALIFFICLLWSHLNLLIYVIGLTGRHGSSRFIFWVLFQLNIFLFNFTLQLLNILFYLVFSFQFHHLLLGFWELGFVVFFFVELSGSHGFFIWLLWSYIDHIIQIAYLTC
jgi:hypothetical protein